MSGLKALALLELRTVVRDRTMQVLFVLTVLLAAGVAPVMDLVNAEVAPLDTSMGSEGGGTDTAPSRPCGDEPLPPLAVDGAWPTWLPWDVPDAEPIMAEGIRQQPPDLPATHHLVGIQFQPFLHNGHPAQANHVSPDDIHADLPAVPFHGSVLEIRNPMA